MSENTRSRPQRGRDAQVSASLSLASLEIRARSACERFSTNSGSLIQSMSKLAVIKTGGKQYLVSPGQKLKIEKIETPVGKEVVFNEVLLVSDSKDTVIGTPLVKRATVEAKVLSQGKHKKITILKFKPKVRYHKKMGHRQPYTEVQIKEING